MIAPDLRQQALAAQYLARVLGELVQHTELPVGQLHDGGADAHLPACQVELDGPGVDHVVVLDLSRLAQLHADAREQLVEREGLAHVVRRAQAEAAELGRQIGAGGDDHDR